MNEWEENIRKRTVHILVCAQGSKQSVIRRSWVLVSANEDCLMIQGEFSTHDISSLSEFQTQSCLPNTIDQRSRSTKSARLRRELGFSRFKLRGDAGGLREKPETAFSPERFEDIRSTETRKQNILSLTRGSFEGQLVCTCRSPHIGTRTCEYGN